MEDCSAPLVAADADAVAANLPLKVVGAVNAGTAPFTLAARIDFQQGNGLLLVDGCDVTLLAPFTARGQCFRCINGGRVLSVPGIHPYTDPSWFGAVGDGVTDSTPALDAMHEWWVSVGGGEIRFAPGDYIVTHGYWVRCAPGATRCHLILTGCTFQNKSVSATDFDHCPLATNLAVFAVFPTTWPTTPTMAGAALTFGQTFQTASAGDTSITLVTGQDPSSFATGKRVVLHGFAMQNGSWPPNERYFEFATVESVVGDVITLTAPLQYNYDERWSDNFTLGPHGGPRILSLDRDDFTWGEELIIDGGTFLSDPDYAPANPKAQGRLQITGYRRARMRNVTAPSVAPQMCDEIIFENVHTITDDDGGSGVLEWDKLVRSGEMLGGDVAALENGFGVLNLHVRGLLCRQFTDLGPRNSKWEDCEFHGNGNGSGNMVVYHTDIFATQRAEFRNCRVDSSQVTPSAVAGLLLGGGEQTFTIITPTLPTLGVNPGAGANGTTKVYVSAEDPTQTQVQNLYRSLEIGRTARTTGGNSCYVTAIYNEVVAGHEYIVVEGEFLSPPSAGDVFRWNNIAELIADVRDIDPSRGIQTVKGASTARIEERVRHAGKRTFVFSERDLLRPASGGALQDTTIAINGRVTAIRLHVQRAHTGAVSVAPLFKVFDADTLAELNGACSFTVGIAASREVTEWWFANAQTGDAANLLSETFYRNLLLRQTDGGVYYTYASVDELPRFTLEVETVRPQ